MTSPPAGTSLGQAAYDKIRARSLDTLESVFPRILPFYPGRFDLSPFLKDCSTVLDIGCGPDSIVGRSIVGYRVGLDIFRDCLLQASKHGTHDDHVQGDVRRLPFREKSFDAVVLLEVLEHLPKDQGTALISSMESVARKAVLLTTPNGFVEQDTVDGNPFQQHLSGWSPSDFKAIGYEVIGLNGVRGLRGRQGRLWLKPKLAAEWMSFMSQRVVQGSPNRAFQLLCIKRL